MPNLVRSLTIINMNLNFSRWHKHSDPGIAPAGAVVFLHGMGGTGQIWRPIAAALEEEWDCIAPDQRGHGGSRPVPESERERFHAEDYAKDVSELLESLGIAHYWIVGHSMGVRTALALARREPEKTAGITAIDIGVTSDWGGGIGIPLADFIQTLPETFPDRTSMRSHLFARCPDPAIAQYLSAVARNIGKKTPEEPEAWVFPFEHAALVKTIHQAHRAPLRDWLLECLGHGIPVEFLRGADSKVWKKEEFEEQKSTIRHPLLQFHEWEGCGHGLPFEQRARFTTHLRSVLRNSVRLTGQ